MPKKKNTNKDLASAAGEGSRHAVRSTIAVHTPGPWEIRIAGTMTGRGPEVYREGEHYEDGSEFVVADCGCSEATGGGTRWRRTADADAIEANARLIAAAPELLDACIFVKAFLDKLEGGLSSDDPLTGLREKFHAPLHAKLDAAIGKALGTRNPKGDL